jgi:topoisomerase IA-like protein
MKLFDLPRDLGEFEGAVVTVAVGRFGPYIKHGNAYITLPKTHDPLTITLDEATQLIDDKQKAEAERVIKKFDEEPDMQVLNGRFGPYIKYGDKNVSLPRGTDPLKVDLDTCIKLIDESLNKKTGGIIAEFAGSDIQVIDGSYGPYIKHAGSNYKLPKGTDATTLTEEQCKEIIASSEPTGRKKRRK